MALIKCPECGQEISSKAVKCVYCGYPLRKKRRKRKMVLTLVLVVLTFFVTVIGSSCYVLYKNKWDYSEVINTISAGNFSCILGHDWKKATCTEPKKCLICGTTRGEALGHTWREASCVEPKTCTVCLITEGEALGHSTRMGTCSKCGDYITDLDNMYDEIVNAVHELDSKKIDSKYADLKDEYDGIVDSIERDVLVCIKDIISNLENANIYSDKESFAYVNSAIESSRDTSDCLADVIKKAGESKELGEIGSYLYLAKSCFRTYPEGVTVNASNSRKYIRGIHDDVKFAMNYLLRVLKYEFE